jgi:signal transduction histidine kinase
MAAKRAESRSKRVKKRAQPRQRNVRRARTHASKSDSDVRVAERVIAGLAHDLRTPLTGLIVASELLGASELTDRQRRWVDVLKGNAEHLAALTTLVVDAARRNGGDFVFQGQTFSPRVLADAAAASLRARAEGARLECKVNVAADLPPQVFGDVVRLRAALENLIDNAVKFTQKGEVGFAVNAEPSTRGIRLLFTVSDSGIGMTAAETKRLFRPFTQAHEGIAKRFGGSGLGLSLVKRLAKAMGGDLKVESTPGRGSTFVLTVVVANSGG